MALRNFFSGVESAQHFKAVEDSGAKHLLMSYLYAVKQQGNILAIRRQANPSLKFMIDSGAHTLQMNYDKPPYATWTMADYQRYVEGYAKWLLANKQYIFAAVELDIASCINHVNAKPLDDPYGDTVIDDWRKKIFMPLQAKGLPIIYVWHASQGHAGWESLCSSQPYVGLPGEMSKRDDFNIFAAVARRYLTKIHGFAATKSSDFREGIWYSVDSTTWKAGEIWGTLPVWDDRRQRLRFLKKTDNRNEYRDLFLSWGLDADAIINDTDYQQVTTASLRSMTAMEEFYKTTFKNKVFYYQLRLPHPDQVSAVFPPKYIHNAWAKFQPQKHFKLHADEKDKQKLFAYVHAIACVQYQLLGNCSAVGKSFLETYFPDILGAPVVDSLALAKELAMLVSPGNEPAKRRVTEDDYASDVNPAKLRDADDLPEIDLVEEIPGFLKALL